MELLTLQQKSASQESARGSCGDHSDVTERRATETLKAEEERRHSTENWSRNASTGDAAADGDVIAGSNSDMLRAEEHEDTREAASHLLTSVKAELTTSGTEELEGACAVGDDRSRDVDADVTSSSADDSSDSFIIDVIAGANQPAGACDEPEDDVTSETFNEDDLAISAIACSNACPCKGRTMTKMRFFGTSNPVNSLSTTINSFMFAGWLMKRALASSS